MESIVFLSTAARACDIRDYLVIRQNVLADGLSSVLQE